MSNKSDSLDLAEDLRRLSSHVQELAPIHETIAHAADALNAATLELGGDVEAIGQSAPELIGTLRQSIAAMRLAADALDRCVGVLWIHTPRSKR